MTRDPNNLDEVRQEIRQLDAAILDLVARRIALARRAGELKRASGEPLRNYAVEAEVIRLARERAVADGLPETLAEDMVKMLIRESLRAQERDTRGRARERPLLKGSRALIIGGAGNMGRWFAEFLETKGFGITIADPRLTRAGSASADHAADPKGADRGTPERWAVIEDVAGSADAFDLILIATPPSAVGPTLRSLAGRTNALVFEIGSLKSPFLEDLRALAKAGGNVTSIHPMWGPKTDLLASKNVVICDCGVPDATRAARALFEDTAARIVELPVDEHDAYMARTLGLPHAVNLVFGHALAQQGMDLERLDHLGGPTFLKQAAVAREVAAENKDLYHEIQIHNPHTPATLRQLRESLAAFEAALHSRDAFRAYMAEAERYFAPHSGGKTA